MIIHTEADCDGQAPQRPSLLRLGSVGISEVFNAFGPNGYSGSRCS